MTIRHLIIALTVCFSTNNVSLADQLTIGVGHQADSKKNINRPYRGMKKHEVYERFGDPINETAAIGQPAISSWKFKDFTVYFESEYVIRSVLHYPDPASTQDSTPIQ